MGEHETMIHERVALARSGDNPFVIARLPSGWAVMGDHQFIEGYSLLLPDPVVGHLNDLDDQSRGQYLADMARLGDALLACTDAVRINYEILGNTDTALHAHVFPRYASEPDERRRHPVWLYGQERLQSVHYDEAVHGALRRDLAKHLT